MHRGKAKIRYLVKKAVVEYWEEEGEGEEFFWIERSSSWNDLMRRERK